MALTKVVTDGIAAGAVTATQIATNAVTVDDISDGSISTAKLADDSVTGDKLANTAVTAGTYGSSSAIPSITVDAQGRITSASTSSIDSTAITNGTSNVSVAASGNITATRAGTQRLAVTSTGINVTGTVDADFLTADGLTVDTNVLHVDSTNDRVGIGLTSPANTLHVRGPASGTILNLDRGGSYSWKFGQSSGSHLTITGDTTERFRFGPDGQLGIGGANYGSSGQVLTSQGSSAAPQWASLSTGRILNVFTDVLTSGQTISVNNGSTNTAAAWSSCDLDLTCSFSNAASNCIIIADIKWGGTFNFVYRIRDVTSNQIVLGQQGNGGANQQANSSGPAGSSGPNTGNQFSVASNTSVVYYNPPSNSTSRRFIVEFLGANGSGNVYLGRTINNDNGLYAAKAPCTLTVLEVAP